MLLFLTIPSSSTVLLLPFDVPGCTDLICFDNFASERFEPRLPYLSHQSALPQLLLQKTKTSYIHSIYQLTVMLIRYRLVVLAVECMLRWRRQGLSRDSSRPHLSKVQERDLIGWDGYV